MQQEHGRGRGPGGACMPCPSAGSGRGVPSRGRPCPAPPCRRRCSGPGPNLPSGPLITLSQPLPPTWLFDNARRCHRASRQPRAWLQAGQLARQLGRPVDLCGPLGHSGAAVVGGTPAHWTRPQDFVWAVPAVAGLIARPGPTDPYSVCCRGLSAPDRPRRAGLGGGAPEQAGVAVSLLGCCCAPQHDDTTECRAAWAGRSDGESRGLPMLWTLSTAAKDPGQSAKMQRPERPGVASDGWDRWVLPAASRQCQGAPGCGMAHWHLWMMTSAPAGRTPPAPCCDNVLWVHPTIAADAC